MNAKLFKANFMKISCYFNRKIGKDCKKDYIYYVVILYWLMNFYCACIDKISNKSDIKS